MSEQLGRSKGVELDARMRSSDYADNLRAMPRWSRYMTEGTDVTTWRDALHADSDGLDQARLMLNLTAVFLDHDTENSAGLSEQDKELLFKAVAAQNWGKSYDDELSISSDISYEFITPQDIEHRIRKFHKVYQELVPEADVKERYIVERTIYDRNSRLGKVFDAIRRLSCLRTGLIAYNEHYDHLDDPAYEQLGALSLGVLSNQLIPLIGYAEEFQPVKDALAHVSNDIDTIFADNSLRNSPLINNQQTLDSIDHAQIIWERVYNGSSAADRMTHTKNETIFSNGSAFEKRFIDDKSHLKTIIEGLRTTGMRIVLTSGSFDLLHVGHAAYLEKAAELGDLLVVGVDSDAKIRKRKGEERPIVREEERVRLLSHLRGVGLITLKDPDEERWGLIKLVRPDVLVVTAETYSPDEIRELERNYCRRVVILEPQATTSTGAQIRRIEIGATKRTNGKLAKALGERVQAIMSSDTNDGMKLEEIRRIFDDETAD